MWRGQKMKEQTLIGFNLDSVVCCGKCGYLREIEVSLSLQHFKMPVVCKCKGEVKK
jgi:hypothetical protein